jgi:lipopolysaccharide export system permease protein
VVAVGHVLNKLGTDSEIIVMNGAGMRPWQLFAPFLAVTLVACLLLGSISAYFAPECLRMLRRWLTEVRTDLVSNIVQPGRFIAIQRGLAFHIRERRANGLLVGLVLDDRRDPKERVTILAEQGAIVKNDRGNFLVLENGSIQRQEYKQRDPNIVVFDRYAFDLSQFANDREVIVQYSVRERYLWQLIWPDPDDPQLRSQAARFRTEMHDRILAPIYPLAFVVIAFAFLGAPRTTRQSRVWSMVSVILAVSIVRMIGFASTVLGLTMPIALSWQYIAVGIALLLGGYAIWRGMILEPPAFLLRIGDAWGQWLQRRAGLPARSSP